LDDRYQEPGIQFDQDLFPASDRTETVSTLQSLSRAIKVGFLVLKILMLILAGLFIFSNVHWVPEGSIAVQLRFGDIAGSGNASVFPPGGPYLAFPYPIDAIITIPTTIQKITLFNSFWSEKDNTSPAVDDRPETEGLQPGLHGSLVTADKNIVQGIWVIHYKLDTGRENPKVGSPAINFVCNVGSMERAVEIIQRIAEAAIVRVVAQTDVAEYIAGRIDNNEIKRMIATRLTSLRTGLVITSVSASRYSVPKVLVPAFEAVTQAESQKALDIEKSSRHRASVLNELAGSRWQELLESVKTYEKALQQADPTDEETAFEASKEKFLAEGTGGHIKQILDEARSQKASTIEQARASAARFVELLPSFEKHPNVLKDQLLQDTMYKIWSDISAGALYVPKGQRLFLDVGQPNSFISK